MSKLLALPEFVSTALAGDAEPRAKITALMNAMLPMPQEDAPLVHRFMGGMYAREIFMRAGLVVVSKVHKQEHIAIVLCGRATVYQEDGQTVEVIGPSVFITPAGRGRALYIHEDCRWLTVHATQAKTVEDAEDELVAPTFAAYDREQAAILHRQDYGRFLEHFGFTEAAVRRVSEFDHDLAMIPPELSVDVAESMIEGLGLIATDTIWAGAIVAPMRVNGLRTLAGRYTNHGAAPNAKPRQHDNGDIDLIAIRDIHPDEEVLVDYRDMAAINTPLANLISELSTEETP